MDSNTKRNRAANSKNYEKKAPFPGNPNKRKFAAPVKQKDFRKQSILCRKRRHITPSTMFLELTGPHETSRKNLSKFGAGDAVGYLKFANSGRRPEQRASFVASPNKVLRKLKIPRLSSTFDLEEKVKKVLRLSYDIDRYSRKHLEHFVQRNIPMSFKPVNNSWKNMNPKVDFHASARKMSSQNGSTIIANTFPDVSSLSQSSSVKLKLDRPKKSSNAQTSTVPEGHAYLDSIQFGAKCSRIFGSYKDSIKSDEASPSYSLASIPAATDITIKYCSGSEILRWESSNRKSDNSEIEILNEEFVSKINYEFCRDSETEQQEQLYKNRSLELLRSFRNSFDRREMHRPYNDSTSIFESEDINPLQRFINADNRVHYLRKEQRRLLEEFAGETVACAGLQTYKSINKNEMVQKQFENTFDCKLYNISTESKVISSKPLVSSDQELELQVGSTQQSQLDPPESTRILYFNVRKNLTNSSTHLDAGRSSLGNQSIKSFDPNECLKELDFTSSNESISSHPSVAKEGDFLQSPKPFDSTLAMVKVGNNASNVSDRFLVKYEANQGKSLEGTASQADDKGVLDPYLNPKKEDLIPPEQSCDQALHIPLRFEYYLYVEAYPYFLPTIQYKPNIQNQAKEFEKRILPFVELVHIGDFYRPLTISSQSYMVKVEFDEIKSDPEKVLNALNLPQKAGTEGSSTATVGKEDQDRYGKLSPWRPIAPFNIQDQLERSTWKSTQNTARIHDQITASLDLLENPTPRAATSGKDFLTKDVGKDKGQMNRSQSADIFGEGDSYFTDLNVNILRNNNKNFLGPTTNVNGQKNQSVLPASDQTPYSTQQVTVAQPVFGVALTSNNPRKRDVHIRSKNPYQKSANREHKSIYNSILDKIYNVENIKTGVVFIVHVSVFIAMVFLLSLPESKCEK